MDPLIPENAMLTTIDNPYDPHTQWDEWYKWDVSHGYLTSEWIARLANLDEEDSYLTQESKRQNAILNILDVDTEGMYALV